MKILVSLLILTSVFFPAIGAELTPKQKEAKVVSLVDNGIQFINSNGIDKAVTAFSDKNGKFISGEFYLYVYELDGTAVVVGANPTLNKKNLIDLSSQDKNGKKVFQVRELINIAKTKGEGWFEWAWQNPTTKKFGPKKGFVKKITSANKTYVIGSGYYVGDAE